MLVYALAKFAAYSAWCGLGLHVLAGRASLAGALRFGAIRWLLGLAFGLAAGVALGSVDATAVTGLYFGVYIPLRAIEWSIMVFLMTRSLPRRPSAWLWVVGGMIVSFASDLASPEGMAGRFCVGRCLC